MTRKRRPTRGGVRAGAGRKPVADVARNRLVPLRMTQDEYDAVAAVVAAWNASRAAGAQDREPMTVSSWFRTWGVRAAAQHGFPSL